jgi:hypothetical protein
MNVQATQARSIQNSLRQNKPVSRHNQHIQGLTMYGGFQGVQGVFGFLAFFQTDRLQHGDAMLLCQLFNRGSL